jgi:hypothetical protein
MGSNASKEYKGPDNPKTDNIPYVVEKYTEYIKDNQYNILYIFYILIFTIFFILALFELISNISLYRTRKRTYK